jgi:hypothetical protein
MDQFCLALPILPGKSDDARAFMAELDRPRNGQYDASERRIGISKEAWFLAPLPAGEHLIAYMESGDIQGAIGTFIGSQDAFDLWFKRRLLETTGLDMHNLPADVQFPTLLSAYAA